MFDPCTSALFTGLGIFYAVALTIAGRCIEGSWLKGFAIMLLSAMVIGSILGAIFGLIWVLSLFMC